MSTHRPGPRPVARLAGVATLALTVGLCAVPVVPAHAAGHPWIACTGSFDHLRVAVRATTGALVTVRQTSRTYARVTLWQRQAGETCRFTRIVLDTSGRLGYGGTVAAASRVQGSGTTPRGVFTMTRSFGNGPAPATRMPYRRVGPRDYWVEDNASPWYNTYRSSDQGGFRTGAAYSEHLVDFGAQYRYSVVIDYNLPPAAVRHRGAGIFLHVKSSGATAGCVAISRPGMQRVMGALRPGDLIAIG